MPNNGTGNFGEAQNLATPSSSYKALNLQTADADLVVLWAIPTTSGNGHLVC